MYPILFQWGSLVLPSWHFFYVVGAIVGYFMFIRGLGSGNSEVSEQDGSRIFAISYVSGYFGARALSIILEEPESHNLLTFLDGLTRFGAMTFYGGAVAGALCGLCYVLIKGLPLAKVLDAAIPAFLVALGFGRIGCFLNGDDYGRAIDVISGAAPWWSVTIPVLGDGVARYPVQLWEASFGLVFGSLLFRNSVKKPRRGLSGTRALAGTSAYAVFRFWNEYYRGDDRKWVVKSSLSTSQGISLALLFFLGLMVPFWIRYSRRISDGGPDKSLS